MCAMPCHACAPCIVEMASVNDAALLYWEHSSETTIDIIRHQGR
jgi:hypothetical protein